MTNTLSRRALLAQSAALAAACGVLASTAKAESACHTADAPNPGKRESLHYTDESPDLHKICDVCMYFKGDNGCGTCRLLMGPVDPAGTCDSWKAIS